MRGHNSENNSQELPKGDGPGHRGNDQAQASKVAACPGQHVPGAASHTVESTLKNQGR